MGLLAHTADQVKSRQIRIERWGRDPGKNQRIAFRATIEGTTFWISARKAGHDPDEMGIMLRLAKKAAAQDTLLLIRLGSVGLRDGLVFDPQAFLDHGEVDTRSPERRKRGERWVNLPTSMACRLSAYVDGREEPRSEPDRTGQRKVGEYSGFE